MKPTIKNYIKLWWHCLIKTFEVPGHRMASIYIFFTGQKRIGCSECDIIIKQELEDLRNRKKYD